MPIQKGTPLVTRERAPLFYGPDMGSIEELALIAAFLDGRARSDVFTKLAALFTDDFAAFLAVFQGEAFDVPARVYLERSTFYCRVWLYVTEKGDDLDAYREASRVFNIPVGRVKGICLKVKTHLERLRKYNQERAESSSS